MAVPKQGAQGKPFRTKSNRAMRLSFHHVLGPQEYLYRVMSAGGRYKEQSNANTLLTSAHNSLSQRLCIELCERGHNIRVCVASAAEAMIDAVSREAPDLILAPMLKIAIPEEIWSRHLCLIVHPGVRGDRGPSSLDWAIANNEKTAA